MNVAVDDEENRMDIMMKENVSSLIEASKFSSSKVRESALSSLKLIIKKYPRLTVQVWIEHFEKIVNEDYASSNRVFLLQCLEFLIESVDSDFVEPAERPVIGRIIGIVCEEMTKSSVVVPDVQKPCSSVLVALGRRSRNVDRVVDVLMTKIHPSSPPHFYVMMTFSSLASANPLGIVPYLHPLLTVMTTTMTTLKIKLKENLRYAYSQSYSSFSDAILDYLVSSSDPPLTKDEFSKEMDAAHDVLFSNWLSGSGIRESKLRNAVLEALGQTSSLLSDERLRKTASPIVSYLIGLYKRIPSPEDSFHVTRCISHLLLPISDLRDPEVLEPVIVPLLTALFTQTTIHNPEYYNSQSSSSLSTTTTKNHHEVLRCYDVLVKGGYETKIIQGLLERLQASSDETVRVSSLVILKHLLNSSMNSIENQIESVISVVHGKLNDPSLRVRRVLAQLTALLGNLGYLNQSDPSRRDFIRFIVKNSAERNEERRELAEMCDSILLLLTNGGKCELWPYLLNYVMIPDFVEARSLIQCLSILASQKRQKQSPDYAVDYSTLTDVPGPYSVFARLLILTAYPTSKSSSSSVFILLRNFASNVDERLITLWDQRIPLLQHYLDTTLSTEVWIQSQWEDWLFLFVEDTLKEINRNEEWIEAFAGSILNQIDSFYRGCSREKGFLIKVMGVIMKRFTTRQSIMDNLSAIFLTVNHSVTTESEACSEAYGTVSSIHPEYVLEKIETLSLTDNNSNSNNGHTKRTGNFLLSFLLLRDSKVDQEHSVRTRITILRCIGRMTLSNPWFLDKLDTMILQYVLPALRHKQNPLLNAASLKTVTLMARSVAGSKFEFAHHGDLINEAIQCVKTTGRTGEIEDRRIAALNAILQLIRLPPTISTLTRASLLKACFNSVLPCIISTTTATTVSNEDDTNLVFNDVIIEILKQDNEQSTLDEMFTLLEDYLKRELCRSRELASSLLLSILRTYFENLTFFVGCPSTFAPGPYMIGTMLPRCFDSSEQVRKNSLRSVDLVLKIFALYEGRKSPPSEEKLIKGSRSDYISKDVIEILGNRMSHDHLLPFFYSSFEGILDKISSSSRGTAVVIHGLMKSRGSEICTQAPDLVIKLQEKLNDLVEASDTKDQVLSSIRTLMAHNPKGVVESLLKVTSAEKRSLADIWRHVPSDHELCSDVLKLLLKVISNEIQGHSDTIVLSALRSLAVMFENRETDQVIGDDDFGDILVTLLLILGSYSGSSSFRSALFTLTSFLSCTGQSALAIVVAGFTSVNDIDVDPDLTPDDSLLWTFMQRFVRCLIHSSFESIPKIVSLFERYINNDSSSSDHRRFTAVTFFASLLDHQYGTSDSSSSSSSSSVDIANQLVKILKEKSSFTIKVIVLRSLAKYRSNQTSFTIKAIGVMIECIDDDESAVVYHALIGIRDGIENNRVRNLPIHVITTLGLKVRPFFDSGGSRLSEAAIRLFSTLITFDDAENKTYHEEVMAQIQGVMVSVLLHLDDEVESVKIASRDAVEKIVDIIATKSETELLKSISDYSSFVDEFCSVLAKSGEGKFGDVLTVFIVNCLGYFQSPRPYLRRNAIVVTTSLVSAVVEETALTEISDTICSAFRVSIKDSNETVRSIAARQSGKVFIKLFRQKDM